MIQPATRVGDTVIFPGGKSRKLTEDEMAAMDRGEELTLRIESGHHTPLVGENTKEG